MSHRFRALFVMAVALLLAPAAAAQGADPGGSIEWSADLASAFAQAKAKRKILMICVNAKFVDGRKDEEPANKGLREVVYRDKRVVAKSREFVCALITPASGSSEFGELRLLGIEGALVSPQHIFVHPDGTEILLRKQYWSHGKDENAVQALLAMMTDADQRLADASGKPAADEPKPEQAAPEGDKRAGWIQERIREVVEGKQKDRERAIDLLIRSDKAGDCTGALCLLLVEPKQNPALLVDLIRGLGRDKLHDAALPVAQFLAHKEPALRGNAAVSLEYIGNRDPKVVAALRKSAGTEKDDAIANHMFRALGRCGVEDAAARTLLLKKCTGAKSEFASYGPAIGLAYFEGDSKAARGLEKAIAKIGVPGGRRGGGQNTVKRGVLCWALVEIGDKKSGDFVREELLAKLENVQAFWVDGMRAFYRNVARACDGDQAAKGRVAGGVQGFVGFAKGFDPDAYSDGATSMMDTYRTGREAAGFTPKGDNLLGGAGG